jgi:uncharacterized protein YndB with AHSA1/START domain
MSTFEKITIEVTVNVPVEKVWEFWNNPEHIKKWCAASPDWHTPQSENDLKVGGHFSTRMEAKDGSFGFDFGGIYDTVKLHEEIAYTIGDGRRVDIRFIFNGGITRIVETFDAETENPIEMQRAGWQAILDNFKVYAEGKG